MSLLGHLRTDVGDVVTSGTSSFTLNPAVAGGNLVGQLRVDVADVDISGVPTSPTLPAPVNGGQLVTHFRVNVGDVVSQTGVGSEPTLTASFGTSELITHLRVDISDITDTVQNPDGCLIVDCADITGDLNIGGDIVASGDISTSGNLTVAGDIVLNGAQCWNTTIVTGSYAATSMDTMILVNNATSTPITLVLPATPCLGRIVYVKDIAGNANTFNITVVSALGTIDGLSGFIISQNYQAITLLYNGTEWSLI